jgi:hypothetical protein
METGRRLAVCCSTSLILCVGGACTDPVETSVDEPAVVGLYLLDRVDGAPRIGPAGPLPACAQPAVLGALSLERTGEQLGDFSVLVRTDPAINDFGRWSGASPTLRFESTADQGSYTVSLRTENGIPHLAFTRNNVEYDFRLAPSSLSKSPVGSVDIDAVDVAGARVTGIAFSGVDADGFPVAGTALSALPYRTGGASGEWYLEVTAPLGYALAPTQPSRFCVSVPPRVTTAIHVSLVRTSSGDDSGRR